MPIDTPDKPAAAHDRDALLARLALQQAPIATMVLDGEHRVTAWNDACAA
jgi:PAS domain-containing protein